MNVYYFLSQYQTRNMSGYESLVWQAAFGLTLPIAGWLADTRIRRYKVIRCSDVDCHSVSNSEFSYSKIG